MRDFLIKPDSKFEHGVFLVKNLANLNIQLLKSILRESSKANLLVSFERLFKDSESALVIFGPKTLLLKYAMELNLLELEDYANLDLNFASVFESTIKSTKDLRVNLPKLATDERIWIQLIIRGGEVQIPYQMRIVIYSAEGNLAEEFQKNYKSTLPKIPKPYSKNQLFEFYKIRSFIKEGSHKLKIEDVLNFSLFL